MSSNIEKINESLKKFSIYLLQPAIIDPTDKNHVIIFLNPSPRYTGVKRLSKFAFSKAVDKIEDLGYRVTIHLSDGERSDLISSLKFSLFKRYQGLINNIFLDENKEGNSIWIDLKKNIGDISKQEIVYSARIAAETITQKPLQVSFLDEANKPTPTIILSALRIAAPSTAVQLSRFLQDNGFDVPSSIWVRSELRKLCNKGVALRLSSEHGYSLTYKGLMLLGSGKSRFSPDVRRALALARRKT